MNTQKILIVDDSEMNRALLVEMLEAQYDIVEAENGANAIQILQRDFLEFSLVLLDIVMPGMNGFDVLEYMNRTHLIEHTAVIMISSDDSNENIKKAYDMGAFDYINRPFDSTVVQHRVSNTMLLYTKQHRLENMVVEQIYEQQKNSKLMISILSHIVEFRNGESGRHVTNVGNITELLLKQLIRFTDRYPLSASDISLISTVSALHDIGKISIPDEILNKPGRLTAEEFAIMKRHAAIGADMIHNLPIEEQESAFIKIAHDICRWHHERYDGGGYPDGLKGDEIPIAAQAVAVADVYDALTSERCYKAAYSHEEAVRMILQGECGAFNPLLLDCLESVGNLLESVRNKEKSPLETEVQLIQEVREKLENHDLLLSKRNMDFIDLLEFEQQRFRVLSEASANILFSYNIEMSVLMLNPYGARILGLEERIISPESDTHFQEVLDAKSFRKIMEKIQNATPETPFVRMNIAFGSGEGKKVFCFVCKVIWTAGQNGRKIGVVGYLLETHPKLPLDSQDPVLNLMLPRYFDTEGKYPSLSSAGILEIMRYLQTVFDTVRLIDVSGAHEVTLDENGVFIPAQEHCYTAWCKTEPCAHCICAKALASKGRASKLEFIGGSTFYVIAAYLEVDGRPFSLVMATQLADEIFLDENCKKKLISSVRSYYDQLYLDPLTNVYNRRYYEEYLRELDREQAVAVLDVDNLKYINDRYGHSAGDLALQRVAKAVSVYMNAQDITVRYGGDEFLLVFRSCSLFSKTLEKICRSVDSITFADYPEMKLSVSLGGVYGSGKTIELFQAADSVLYRAKKIKNKAMVYSLQEWKEEHQK